MSEFRFQLADNLHKHTLFIVDEASMISNNGTDGSFERAVVGRPITCSRRWRMRVCCHKRMAQPSPVEQPVRPLKPYASRSMHWKPLNSPSHTWFGRHSKAAYCIMPPSCVSGFSRRWYFSTSKIWTERFYGHKPLERIGSDRWNSAGIQWSGVENTIVITRSNKRANMYNNGIRSRVMMKEEELSNGDLLMVTRNNYLE